MPHKVISFHYTLTDPAGKTLDSSLEGEPLAILTGVGQIIPGLETHLLTMKAGDKRKVRVPAQEAYGPRDPANVAEVPRERMPVRDIKVGDRFRAGSGPQAPVVVVTAVTETHVTLDGNHPLAGMDLAFDIEVTEVRDATEEELAHGHVHGPGGHQH